MQAIALHSMNLSQKTAAVNTTKNSIDATSDHSLLYSQALQEAVAKSKSIVAAEATRRYAEAEVATEEQN